MVHHCGRKSPPLDPVLIQGNPVHAVPSRFVEIRFNTPVYFEVFLMVSFPKIFLPTLCMHYPPMRATSPAHLICNYINLMIF
jgi:hypothetical protein